MLMETEMEDRQTDSERKKEHKIKFIKTDFIYFSRFYVCSCIEKDVDTRAYPEIKLESLYK